MAEIIILADHKPIAYILSNGYSIFLWNKMLQQKYEEERSKPQLFASNTPKELELRNHLPDEAVIRSTPNPGQNPFCELWRKSFEGMGKSPLLDQIDFTREDQKDLVFEWNAVPNKKKCDKEFHDCEDAVTYSEYSGLSSEFGDFLPNFHIPKCHFSPIGEDDER